MRELSSWKELAGLLLSPNKKAVASPRKCVMLLTSSSTAQTDVVEAVSINSTPSRCWKFKTGLLVNSPEKLINATRPTAV